MKRVNRFKRQITTGILILLSVFSMKSQNWTCTYDVTNNLGCSITLDVTFSQETAPGSGICAVCTTTSIIVPANSTVQMFCGSISALCTPNSGSICNVTAQMTSPATTGVATWGNPSSVTTGCSTLGSAEVTIGAQTLDVREVP